MPHEISRSDRIRMLHMIDAAQQALAYSAGRGRTDLDADSMYRRACVNCIQEIGEAANRVAPQSRQLIAAVPWQQIVGMRNRLVHAYFNIEPEAIWDVIANNLQPLIDALESALAGPPPADPSHAGEQP